MKLIFLFVILGVLPLANYAAAAPSTVSDAQIAQILITANKGEIEEAKLAEKNAISEKVREFAQEMETDHSASKSEVIGLAARLNLIPTDSAISQKLASGSEKNITNLEKAKGAAFDRTYLDAQVAAHEAVLDLFDQTLIPDVENEDLKRLVQNTRPAIARHLEHAKKVQAKLGKKK